MSIEAMKQALEALEAYRPVIVKRAGLTYSIGDKAITALRQAIEQAERQEPVAWMTFDSNGGEDDIWYENPEGKLLEGWTYIPLYTSPHTRQPWAGLTDEDKQIAFDDTQEGGGFWEFADAIEATLRKKNHG